MANPEIYFGVCGCCSQRAWVVRWLMLQDPICGSCAGRILHAFRRGAKAEDMTRAVKLALQGEE